MNVKIKDSGFARFYKKKNYEKNINNDRAFTCDDSRKCANRE